MPYCNRDSCSNACEEEGEEFYECEFDECVSQKSITMNKSNLEMHRLR